MSIDSKIIPPYPALIAFYQIYSTVVLAVTWCILPILIYVIFTQSGNLREFKWTILNHSFWCLCLATVLGISKPVLLTPAFAGFQVGPFRYIAGNNATGVTGGICCAILASSTFALCATLASRYLLIFPSKLKDLFTVKKFFYIGVLSPIFFYIVFGIIVTWSGSESLELNFQQAIDYDPSLKEYILKEPTFTFVPYTYHQSIDVIILAFFVSFFGGGIGIIIFFKYQVAKHKTVTLTKLHKSLILSSIIQIVLISIFLFIPIICFITIIFFNIPNSANLLCILLSLLNSHCLIDFFTTLYFIQPYRAFINRIIYRKVLKKPLGKTVTIPTFSVSSAVRTTL